MKVLCFDIGIKNLGLCLMENNAIVLWKLLNVLEGNQNQKKTCSAPLKAGNKTCSSMASFKEGRDVYYCKRHKTVDSVRFRKVKVNCKNITLEKCSRLFIDTLEEFCQDNETFLKDLNVIGIEQQPGKNQRMKFISILVYTFFMMKFKDVKVCFVSPRNKTKPYTGPKSKTRFRNTYKNRKKEAVDKTIWALENVIKDPEQWKVVFKETKKKDDLADSFWHCSTLLDRLKNESSKVSSNKK